MPLWFFPLLLGACAIVSLVSAIWLILHLPDVARAFSRRESGHVVADAARRGATRAQVWTALVLFNAGWVACVLIWVFVMGGDANAVVDAKA